MKIPLERGPNAPPLYIQVAHQLRQRIAAGEWQDGDALPSEKALCREYDIARGTLRQALDLLEGEGLVRREQGRGTFRTAATQQVETRHLAFIVPYVRATDISVILSGFQEIAEEARYSVIFNNVNNDREQQAHVIQRLVDQGVQGIALFPVDSHYHPAIDRLIADAFPMVMVDRYIRGISSDYVMSDHFSGALRGVQHLISLGHRRIGLVTGHSTVISMEHRTMGYVQALQEHGIELTPSLFCETDGYPQVDHQAICVYLEQPDRPTAVFTINDRVAAGVYRAAREIGLKIPQDLSIVSFDNLEMFSHLEPPLTTLSQPFQEIGRTAARILVQRVQRETHVAQQVTLTPPLIVRDSCAALQMPESF